jgi:hypothetical protein
LALHSIDQWLDIFDFIQNRNVDKYSGHQLYPTLS